MNNEFNKHNTANDANNVLVAVILSTDELKELLEKAFSNGALSHSKWDGQRDTCWSNVNEDMKEYVSAILSDLNIKVVTNNCA